MAAHTDLARRKQAIGAGEVYLSDPPAWFRRLLDQAHGAPLLVNVRGKNADDCPIVVTLAEFERLTGKGATTA